MPVVCLMAQQTVVLEGRTELLLRQVLEHLFLPGLHIMWIC